MSSIAAAIMGFAGGMVGGLLGVGGGILFVPALAIFMDETQVRAEATSLLAIVPVALVAVWRQRGYGNVRVREGLVIGALSPRRGGDRSGDLQHDPAARTGVDLRGLALLIAAQLVVRALGPWTGPRRLRLIRDSGGSRRAAVLERALDPGVEGVQPVERQRLGRAEAATARARSVPVRPVM